MIQPIPATPVPLPEAAPTEPTIPSLGAGFDFTDPNSPLAPYYCRTRNVVVIALLGCLFLVFSYFPLWHTDVWGHLKFGQAIVRHGPPLGQAEPPGLLSYWLCQSGMYGVYHLGEILAGGDDIHRMEGGVQMLRALHTLVLAARFVILLLAFRRLGKSLPVAGLALLFVLLLGFGHIAIFRPQTFAELFFACVLLALSRPVLSVRAMILLPLVMAVWANTHGSYTLGLALLGTWLLGQGASLAWSKQSLAPRAFWTDQQVRRLLLVVVFSTAAVAVLNPQGPYIFQNTLRMGENPNVSFMDEWQPIDFRKPGPALWLYVISLTILAFTQVLSKKWFTPSQLLLMLLFGVQPILHQRMLIWWLMLAPWLAASHWATIAERLPRLWPFPESVASFRKTMLAVLLGVVILLWCAPVQWAISGTPARLDKSLSQGTPWQLAEQLRKPDEPKSFYLPALDESLAAYGPAKRFHGRIFASETQGDYLFWSLPDDMPVFVYTHVHLFSAEHWRKCMCVKFGAPGWSEILTDNGVNLIVIEAETHPTLRKKVLEDATWQVVLDETESKTKLDRRTRLFVAIRKKPL